MKNYFRNGLFLAVIFFGAGCTVPVDAPSAESTAPIVDSVSMSEIKTCLSPVENICETEQTEFARDAAEIFVTAIINDATPNTKIDFNWKFINGNLEIDTNTLTSDQAGTVRLKSSLPKPLFEGGWPVGTYQILIKVQDHPEMRTIVKEFSIN